MNPILRLLLSPFSLLYGIGLAFRNLCFNLGILKSESFAVPTIIIGNLKVGGTGKTPHVEYLIHLLSNDFNIAVLSRGYGRKTKGYLLADRQSNAQDIGDESFQVKSKFPNTTVAVSEDRRLGIKQLLKQEHPPEVILLDDAYQHRYVKGDLNILLTEYNDLYIDDYLLPMGRLREGKKGAGRADIIIITKCPKNLTPLEMRSITIDLKLKEYQKTYFSYIEYRKLIPLNKDAESMGLIKKQLSEVDVILMTAIANPKKIKQYIQKYNRNTEILSFPDHYYFMPKDYRMLKDKFKNLRKKKVLIVTEKDATKLDLNQLDGIPCFSLPISIKFHNTLEESIDEYILNYVRKY